MKSKLLFNFKNLLSDDSNILKSFITVVNAQIPCSFYVINNSNNKIVINGPFISVTTVYLTNGNYNANTLITELKSEFANAGIIFSSIKINKINGRLKFTSIGLEDYYFTSDSTIFDVLGTTSDCIIKRLFMSISIKFIRCKKVINNFN